jgi:hypothetical protein
LREARTILGLTRQGVMKLAVVAPPRKVLQPTQLRARRRNRGDGVMVWEFPRSEVERLRDYRALHPELTDAGRREERSHLVSSANEEAGRQLRASRVLLGMDQTALATWLSDELGRPVNQQSVSCWERGTRVVPADVLESLDAATPRERTGP